MGTPAIMVSGFALVRLPVHHPRHRAHHRASHPIAIEHTMVPDG